MRNGRFIGYPNRAGDQFGRGVWSSQEVARARRVDKWAEREQPPELVLVAGGGGGGNNYGGGGGGGGGVFVQKYLPIVSGATLTITIGAGGVNSANGSNSTITGDLGTFTAQGGGEGGDVNEAGTPGGSGGGGGGSGSQVPLVGGVALDYGQGHDGGQSRSKTGYNAGGGGGGAFGVGDNGLPYNNTSTDLLGGNGGDGLRTNITGSWTAYGGGGGGGIERPYAYGVGGYGGGGNGRDSFGGGSNGTANTGGGGGGGGTNSSGALGGSGVAIIRTLFTATNTTGSPTVTTDGAYNIYTFIGSGTITF